MSEMSHAAEQPVESSTVLVDEGVSTPPPASSFSKVVRSPSAPPRGAVGLLLFCLRVITADEDLTVAQLRNPTYEGSVNYLCRVLENGRMDTVFPEVDPRSYDDLHCAATEQLNLYARTPAAGAAPTLGNSSLWASDLPGVPRVDRQWAYNGTTCARLGPDKISVQNWLTSLLSALRGEYSIHDGRQQGLFLRQLVEGPILNQLTRKIEELPELRRAADQGEATFDEYAAALIACSDPDDALACHYAASHPRRNPGEKLSDAVSRADLAFRAAAAHHCEPAAAGRFWAVYGLLTPTERSTYTGRPGIRGQLQRPLRETLEAAATRYKALLADLLSWAKVQSTLAATPAPRPAPDSAAAPEWRPATPRRRRRAGAATAAAARAASVDPSSSEDEAAAAVGPAPPATAAAAASPRGPRGPATFYYTGDRTRDAVETERRRSQGLCFKCLPGGTIHACPCPLHPANARESAAPRCFPYGA